MKQLMFSKLDFNESLKKHYKDKRFRNDIVNLNQLFLSHSVLFTFDRNITKRFSFGIWARKLERGIQSHLKFRPNLDQKEATQNIIRLKSYESGLSFIYELYSNNTFSFSTGLKPSFDVHQSLQVHKSTLKLPSGLISIPNSIRGHYSFVAKSFGKRYISAAKKKVYRYGLYFLFKVQIKTIIKGLSLISAIEFGRSTHLKTKDLRVINFLPDGNILSGSIDFGLLYTL